MAASKAALAAATAWTVCFAPALAGMAEHWWNEPDMGHAFFVPLAMAWIVWCERERLRAAVGPPAVSGWILILLGAGLNTAGSIGAGLFARSLGAWVSAAGAVAVLGGTGLLWTIRFPLALSVFMLPKLGIVFAAAESPLQLLASRMAAFMLHLGGLPVMRDGNVLSAGGRAVEVEAACSGLRYILPLLLLASLWGWQSGARTWVRWALLPAALAIALFANAARVALTAVWAGLAAGWPHDMLGWALFVACLAAIRAVERGLSHV